MVIKLRVENFKSHKNTELSLSNLTLLTGLNSSGKSSVIQTILLLRQSFVKGRLNKGLDLNEPLCDIGKGEDALYRFADKNETIAFEFTTKEIVEYKFHFDAKDKYDDSFIPLAATSQFDTLLPFFTDKFQYLSAGRIAAVEFYPVDSYAVEIDKQISRNYGQGELVAHFLEYYGESRDFNIEAEGLLHNSTDSKKLLNQVIAWEQEISPRLTITTKKVADKITIEYGYKAEDSEQPLNNIKSRNVGFGISYSLAIVVAVLSASPGSILLIENPEAHLHPKGQSKMAELLCLAAQSGIQLVVETHSDHIFNGIRKAVKLGKVDKDNVKVHFFSTDGQNTTKTTEINISNQGRVLNPTEGLFDQFDNDLDEIIGL